MFGLDSGIFDLRDLVKEHQSVIIFTEILEVELKAIAEAVLGRPSLPALPRPNPLPPQQSDP